MATGKRPLRISASYNGDTAQTMSEVVDALNTVRTELSVTPGFAELAAGETIIAGQAVYIAGSQLFKAGAAALQPAIGIALSSAPAGAKVRFILGMGLASKLSGLTPNKSVYLGNAGALVYAIPGAGMKQALGWTLSATEMFVTISQPV